MNEFYVGYLPSAPPAIRRRVRICVAAIVLLAVAGAVLLAASQRGFAKSYFEFGKPVEFSGTLRLQPFPTLTPDPPDGSGPAAEPPYLLVATGKFGADAFLAGQDAKHVRLRGTLIHRAEGHMIEIGSSAVTELADSNAPAPEERDLGDVTLNGEIVDTKCFLGVMNPGEGKVHRDCAARCLSGGIPPALLTADLDGSRRLILLLGEDGKPLPKAAYLQRVGQHVVIHGYLDQSNTFYYLRTNAASIAPLR